MRTETGTIVARYNKRDQKTTVISPFSAMREPILLKEGYDHSSGNTIFPIQMFHSEMKTVLS